MWVYWPCAPVNFSGFLLSLRIFRWPGTAYFSPVLSRLNSTRHLCTIARLPPVPKSLSIKLHKMWWGGESPFEFWSSVPDLDPHVFGSPGSGSISHCMDPDPNPSIIKHKIVRNTLIPTVLWLLLAFLSFKNDVHVPSKRNKQKNFIKIVFVGVVKVSDENSRIRIR